MKRPPNTLHILKSDVEYIAGLEEGRADSVIAGTSPMRNMDGKPMTIEYTRTMPAEIMEELHAVAKGWLRYLDRQKAQSEFLAKAAALARAGDTVEARRMKSKVDSAPRVYDGARMEPVMRKFVKWVEGKKR